MTILTATSAMTIYLQFEANYAELNAKLQSQNQSKLEKIASSRSEAAKAQAALTFNALTTEQQRRLAASVRTLKRKWQLISSEDLLIRVNPNGQHTNQFSYFLNNQQIEKNINREKQRQMLTALASNNWDDPIFQDKLNIQIGFALFSSNKISYHTMETLIARAQSSTPNNNLIDTYSLTTYPILDEHGEFTAEAKEYLLPCTTDFMRQYITDELLSNFRMLLQQFIKDSPSENSFYFYAPNSLQLLTDEMYNSLRKLKSNLQLSTPTVTLNVELSSSAHDAFRLACFGLENTTPARMKLGSDLDISDIEQGTDNDFRPMDGSYPGSDIKNKNIHSHSNVSLRSRSQHDHYHADFISRMGKPVSHILKRIKNLIQQNILSQVESIQKSQRLYSESVWMLIDKEFSIFNTTINNMNNASPQKIVRSLCDAFYDKDDTPTILENNSLTDSGILFLIDIIQNKEEWVKLSFHPELMTAPLKNYYDEISHLKPFLTEDSKFNIALFHLYKQIDDKKHINFFAEFLRKNYDSVKENLIFKRSKAIHFLGLVDKTIDPMIPFKNIASLFILKLIGASIKKEWLPQQHTALNNSIFTASTKKPRYQVPYNYLLSFAFIKHEVGHYKFVQTDILAPAIIFLTKIKDGENDKVNLEKSIAGLEKFIAYYKNKSPNFDLEKLKLALSRMKPLELKKGYLL